jgi:hypothetical protein
VTCDKARHQYSPGETQKQVTRPRLERVPREPHRSVELRHCLNAAAQA